MALFSLSVYFNQSTEDLNVETTSEIKLPATEFSDLPRFCLLYSSITTSLHLLVYDFVWVIILLSAVWILVCSVLSLHLYYCTKKLCISVYFYGFWDIYDNENGGHYLSDENSNDKIQMTKLLKGRKSIWKNYQNDKNGSDQTTKREFDCLGNHLDCSCSWLCTKICLQLAWVGLKQRRQPLERLPQAQSPLGHGYRSRLAYLLFGQHLIPIEKFSGPLTPVGWVQNHDLEWTSQDPIARSGKARVSGNVGQMMTHDDKQVSMLW